MKKYFAIILTIIIVLSMCLCGCTQTYNENGVKVSGEGPYIFVRQYSTPITGGSVYLAQHRDTNILYIYTYNSYGGSATPYLIEQDGNIYGAIWKSGEIVPVPFAVSVIN